MNNIESTQNDLNGAAGGALADGILSRLARLSEKENAQKSEDTDGERADEVSGKDEPDGDGAGDATSASAAQPA